MAVMLVALAQLAAAEEYLNHSSLEIATEISGDINAREVGSSPRLDSISANISFIPFSDEFQVASITATTTTPSAKVTQGSGSVLMNWENIGNEREFRYSIKTEAITLAQLKKIRRQEKFPITDLERQYIGFTEPTEFIDINDQITKKAVEVIDGETDLYKVIFKIAAWVEANIEYDLSTLTAEAVQKSSWVLENRRGVCDELTNLYISMLRSVGIPARFVAGQAYTNIGDKFGEHGWAEVYYPGEGWLPVDVTFGQFGWVDATHVKFKEAMDSGAASADYGWKSRDIELEFGELNIDTRIRGEQQDLETHVAMTIDPLKYKVGSGSYVPVQVILENANGYYVPAKVVMRKAPKLLDEDTTKEVLLAPYESMSLFWVVVIPGDLDPDTIYSTTIEAYSPQAGRAESSIKFADSYEVTSKMWAEDLVQALSRQEGKNFFPNLEWKCSLDKDAYYVEDLARISCTAKNIGNTDLSAIRFCFEADCRTSNIAQGGEEKIGWSVPLTNEKTRKLVITAESQTLIRYSYPTLKMVFDPKVRIGHLNQQPIAYDKQGQMTFTVMSEDFAKNVKVVISRVGQIDIKTLEGGYDVVVNYPGRAFYNGKIDIKITYEDELGKSYSAQQQFDAVVTDLPWYVQLLNWVNSLLKTDIQM